VSLPIGPAVARGQALAAIRRSFCDGDVPEPALGARVLVCAALGIDAAALAAHPEILVGDEGGRTLTAYVARRLAREPVARIVGQREFWGMPFELSPETLVPRPETETVVETALRHLGERGAIRRLLDLGTGSGCLLVALLTELPAAGGIGVDQAQPALAAAKRNADRNGVTARVAFIASDWAAAIDGAFDLIVANPPYIASGVIEGLAHEVQRHDPRLALDGGPDGLSAYRAILADAGRLLAPGALLVLEIGYDQADALPALAEAAGFGVLEVAPDLAGLPRAVALKRPLS
jgi:release factor glutamine methyltransferase